MKTRSGASRRFTCSTWVTIKARPATATLWCLCKQDDSWWIIYRLQIVAWHKQIWQFYCRRACLASTTGLVPLNPQWAAVIKLADRFLSYSVNFAFNGNSLTRFICFYFWVLLPPLSTFRETWIFIRASLTSDTARRCRRIFLGDRQRILNRRQRREVRWGEEGRRNPRHCLCRCKFLEQGQICENRITQKYRFSFFRFCVPISVAYLNVGRAENSQSLGEYLIKSTNYHNW